jgi:hypothetical protein
MSLVRTARRPLIVEPWQVLIDAIAEPGLPIETPSEQKGQGEAVRADEDVARRQRGLGTPSAEQA